MLPESATHHEPHRTGHRWVDFSIAFSAIVVSQVSLVVAISHGRTMERMAEANARLVAANSWPFLQYETGNEREDGTRAISLAVANVGVGPARIESLEIWWHGRPMASPAALLEACCDYQPPPAGTPRDDPRIVRFSQELVASRVLRAGAATTMLDFPRTDAAAAVWDRLNRERLQLQTRTARKPSKSDSSLRIYTCPVKGPQ